MSTEAENTEYRLMQGDYVVGIVTVQKIEDDWIYGSLDLEENIKKRVGWKGVRFADALDALSGFLSVVEAEGEDSRSKKYKQALDWLEDDTISYYACSDEWYVVGENRHPRRIDSVGYLDRGVVWWTWLEEEDRDPPEYPPQPLFTADRNLFRYRLLVDKQGRHRFGGAPKHDGAIPSGTDTPLHHFLTIDLADLRSPFYYDPHGIRYLPLYYPLAYGFGGAEVQYSIDTNDKITIVYMSDSQPDGASIQVSQLPETGVDIVPLTYEEMRMRALNEHSCGHSGSFPSLDPEDTALREGLGGDLPFRLGGPTFQDVSAIICRNPACGSFESEVAIEMIASIPPISINGKTAFWHDYEDGYVEFFFGLCLGC